MQSVFSLPAVASLNILTTLLVFVQYSAAIPTRVWQYCTAGRPVAIRGVFIALAITTVITAFIIVTWTDDRTQAYSSSEKRLSHCGAVKDAQVIFTSALFRLFSSPPAMLRTMTHFYLLLQKRQQLGVDTLLSEAQAYAAVGLGAQPLTLTNNTDQRLKKNFSVHKWEGGEGME